MKASLFAFALAYFALEAGAIELVDVCDLGNPPGAPVLFDVKYSYKLGSVDHPYRIEAKETSNAEYCGFLNAKASKSDPHGLYKKEMSEKKGGLVRGGAEGAWKYEPKTGMENRPVNFVSRLDAARYCNWLSRGKGDADTESGVYRIIMSETDNGGVHEVMQGYRDLTTLDSPILYYLPDAYEWYKAGYYQGGKDGGYRTFKGEGGEKGLEKPSHYGTTGQPYGVREWVESKSYPRPFILGACDANKLSDEAECSVHNSLEEWHYNETTGFRVASTPCVQVGEIVNGDDNFISPKFDSATLRIRSDADRKVTFALTLRDIKNSPVWTKKQEFDLKKGVTSIPLNVPPDDGFYRLEARPDLPAYEGRPVLVNMAVCRAEMPEMNESSHFGINHHAARWRVVYTYETTPAERFKQAGICVIRSGTPVEAAAGIAILPGDKGSISLPRNYAQYSDWNATDELKKKWASHGIPPEFAGSAENIYQSVLKLKEATVWELDNEPHFWRVLAEDYGQMAKYATIAAKAANPKAKLMLGDIAIIHEPALKTRAAEFCEGGVALHMYSYFNTPYWGVADKLRAVKGWLRACGVPDAQVWITEINVGTFNSVHQIPTQTLDDFWQANAIFLPELMAGAVFMGADKILTYDFRDDPLDYMEGECGLIDRRGLPKHVFSAYRTTARLLANATPLCALELPPEQKGRIVALAFRDPNGKDVIILWREHVYAKDDYRKPFNETIGKPEDVLFQSKATSAELITLGGASQRLKAESGVVKVPVDEYPCFLRGQFALKDSHFKMEYAQKPVTFKSSLVKILPQFINTPRAGDAMVGVTINLVPGRKATVNVRLFNLTDKELKGEMSLSIFHSWRQLPWKLQPESVQLTAPPNGMTTAAFTVAVPVGEWESVRADAHFVSSAGEENFDTALLKAGKPEWDVREWTIYNSGFTKEFSNDATELNVSWNAKRPSFALSHTGVPPVVAARASELNGRTLSLEVLAEKDSAVKRMDLVLRDTDGKDFIVQSKSLNATPGKWTKASFILTQGNLKPRGDADTKTVCFPLRLQELNFIFESAAGEAGALEIRPPDFGADTDRTERTHSEMGAVDPAQL